MKRKLLAHIDRNRSLVDVFEHVMLGFLPSGSGSNAISPSCGGPERRAATGRVRGSHSPKRRRGD
jgi:hypothetical protein